MLRILPKLKGSATTVALMILIASLLLVSCGAPGAGNEGPYYQGKTITLLIPFSEGGGTDVWARVMAPYLEKHIEGQPKVVIKNVPGGESITGTNQYVTQAKEDGLLWLGSSGTTVYNRFLGRPEVKYDFQELKPLIVNGTGGVIYVSPKTGIKTVKDLKNPSGPLVYGGISATGLDAASLIVFDLLKLDVKATFGFEGRGPARLALERGETTIDYQTTSAYQSNVAPLVEQGKAIPLMSFGILNEQGEIVRDPAFPDLPTPGEVYKELNGADPSGPAWEAYKSFMPAGFTYQKGLWVPKGTAQEAIDPVYNAVEKMTQDEDFKAKSEEVLGGYPLYRGDRVAEAVREAFKVSEEIQAYMRNLLKSKYDVEF